MVRSGMIISDRYEILEKVGSGGMADVFRARCRRLNRFVAIKFLKQEYSKDTKFVTKFRGEAQSVAGLSHPNIVSIFDVGEDGDLYYIVMEYIEGITLKKYIEDKGTLTVKESVNIALQIANGLNAAHSHNIVHRDIKPQNILISKDRTAKVTDFGIAKAASSNTITSNAMGSVHYISPEQARGGFSDEKSDIYSLGVTMYEMLTGKLPFVGESSVAVALSHVQDEAPSITSIDATIPKGLGKIVEKCMQKRQEQRYLTAEALIFDLQKFLEDPMGTYGVVEKFVVNDAQTKFIPVDEVKARISSAHKPENLYKEKEDSEEEESDVDPKLEKVLVIGSIVVAIIIGLVIIVMLAKFLGLFNTINPDELSTPTPSATAEVDVNKAKVPDVKDKLLEEAKILLANEDLITVPEDEENDAVKEGYVIRTDPASEMEVDKNSTVTVYVSSGPKKNPIPTVIGDSSQDAKEKLEAAGFKVKVGSPIYSEDIGIERVAKVEPKQKSKAAPGTTISIYLSKGPELKFVKVPNLTGLTNEKAKNALVDKGLVLGNVESNYSDTIAKNRVCAQSQAAETDVSVGTVVDITLSLGKPVVYKFYMRPVTIVNPFVEGESIATIKAVLYQNNSTKTIFKEEYTPDDFPITLGDTIEGTSDSDGEIKIYKNGRLVDTLNVTFKKVKQ